MNTTVSHRYKKSLLIALLSLLIVTGLELTVILLLNAGHFTFTLDDAYIHLALAENIIQGHYGVNLNEFSAPSSSILWPFFIAPFSRMSASAYMVLIINTALAAGTLSLFWKVLLPATSNNRNARLLTAILIIIIPAINLIGLIYTGMEHSAQVFLAIWIIAGMIYEVEQKKAPWWLFAAIVIAPLIRYENLAISFPALIFLFARGYRHQTLLTGILLALSLGAFSLFLMSMGLGPIPSSIIAKSSVVAAGGRLSSVITHLLKSLSAPQGVLLIAGMVLLLYSAQNKSLQNEARLLALAVSASVFIHLLGGEYGWYYRYEIYIWASLILTLLYLNKEWLYQLPVKLGEYKAIGFVFLSGLLLGAPYFIMLLLNPLASNIIYKQQYQLHRFATDYYQHPVAVNDLGYISYRNDNYVLDLWGLGSIEALRLRQTSDDVEWMSDLANKKDVKLAMIYDDWFNGVPEDWHKIGELSFTKLWLPPGKVSVSFYSIGCDSYMDISESIAKFTPTLPKGVEITIDSPFCIE